MTPGLEAPTVLVIGEYYVDQIFVGVEQWVTPGREVFSESMATLAGGAFTHARALHRLRVPSSWSTEVGTDECSDILRREAEVEGIDTSSFLEHDGPRRRLTVAIAHEGERGFVSYRDPGDPPDYAAVIRAKRPTHLLAVELMVGEPWQEIVAACEDVGAKILLDPQHSDYTLEDLRLIDTLATLQVFLPNAEEAMSITGTADVESAAIALGHHVPTVVIKNGAYGAVVRHADVTSVVRAPVAPIVVDTVGAGDCFDAGFVAALAMGQPLLESVELGTTCGSISVGGTGGSAAPTLAQIEALWPALVPWAQTAVAG